MRLQVNGTENRGRTPLHYAAQRGSADCIQALLNYGADPNIQDYIGMSAILLLGGYFLMKGHGTLKG